MQPSSRTPEGEPSLCPICGHHVRIEPSQESRDATCPHCGCLLWFDRSGELTADRSLADQSVIGQTKGQIRLLVAEIAKLSRSDATEKEFFEDFIPRVVSALAALGGAVWTLDRDGQLRLRRQIGFEKVGLQESVQQQPEHRRLLHEVLQGDTGALVSWRATLNADATEPTGTAPEAPTGVLLLFGLLKAGRHTVGLVEILQRTGSPPATQQGYLRFLEQMCELASDHLTALAVDGKVACIAPSRSIDPARDGLPTAVRGSRQWFGLILFIAACFAVGGIGGAMTANGIPDWYASLAKPDWTPPNWLFGPVWSALYLSMAAAGWLVWRQKGFRGSVLPMTLFGVQLALNGLWSSLFFAWHSPGAALVDLALLWAAIFCIVVVFSRRSILAAALLAPYLAWVSFAGVLNFVVWRMNS
jgi:translocator protein